MFIDLCLWQSKDYDLYVKNWTDPNLLMNNRGVGISEFKAAWSDLLAIAV